ncbi:hypothetical protein D3C87_76530 [compost metagenome]
MKKILSQFNNLLKLETQDFVEKENDIKVVKEEKVYANCKEYTMKLLFAKTSSGGYYGFLNGVGELFLVGTKNEGIQSEDIMSIFEVNEYGNYVKRF